MLSAHFLAVTPDGCPEEIEAGPFTEERAKDALFAWEMNHGCPARIVVLGEAVEPTKFVLVVPFQGHDQIVPVKGADYTSDLNQAQFAAHQYRLGGSGAEVYGLVPAKE